MNQDRLERIRARAHAIWETEGRPHGAHEAHWRRAEKEIEEGPELNEEAAEAAGDFVSAMGRSPPVEDRAAADVSTPERSAVTKQEVQDEP